MDSNSNFSQDFLNLIRQIREPERFKELLEDSLLYQAADKSGATLLHYAAQYNNSYLTKYLLDKGCDINIQDSKATTPLMIAVRENSEAAMVTLLSAGADIFKLNSEQKGALHMLSEHRTMPTHTIRIFLRELAKKCSTYEELGKKLRDARCPFYQVALLENFKLIEYMIERGSPINSAHPTQKITAVHLAVRYEDLKSLMVLLKNGADVNALNRSRESPLCNLYSRNNKRTRTKIEILKTLMVQGAAMTSCTSNGVFQVYHTLVSGNRLAVRVLIESGLDFNVKDTVSGQTVLHYLAKNLEKKDFEKKDVVEELKLQTEKFDVDVCDKFGQTPLLLAAFDGNVSMVKFLLKLGAKTDLKRKTDGATALFCAYKRVKVGFEEKFRECGELLLHHDADPQVTVVDETGEKVTIFDAALKMGDIDRIKPVVAHLAMFEKRGTHIRKRIRAKINSHESLKKYFEKCRRLLKEKISERVVLFDLLSSDSRKMAQYLNNENIVDKLRNSTYMRKVIKCQYYCSLLNKSFCKGKSFKKLKTIAARMISKLFQESIDKEHLVVDKVTDYLNDQSLRNLCQLYHQLGSLRQGTITLRYKWGRKRKFSKKNIPKESIRNRKLQTKAKTISSKK